MSNQVEESLLSRIHRTVIMEGATGGLANGLESVMAGTHGTDVTGLSGANVGDGSVLHHGPAEGGEALDRPSAAYMAEASTHESVTLEPAGGDISSIARGVNDAGTLSIDGREIQVLDYMPGGDFVQMAAGQVEPSQMLVKLAQHGMDEGMAREQGRSLQAEPGAGSPGGATQGTASGRNDPGASGVDGEQAPGDAAHERDSSGDLTPAAVATRRASGQHVPDADENARDLEALAFEHRLDVDTAIQTSDTAHVHTQLHAHGRTLEIDTDFEATKPDNREEREEASEHIGQVARGVHNEVDHDEPGMHLRSRIAAHLDAASRDEGLSI